jgi:TP901 family phage tail tape measure protein
MSEMKASVILELVDRLTGKTAGPARALDKLEASSTRGTAVAAANARAANSRTIIATRATAAQARANEKLAASTGIYHGHIMSLRRRAEGGGPSAMALGRTYAMTRAFDHLNKKAEEYYAISRRLPRAEREAAAAAATARGQRVQYYGIMRRSERPRGGAFNGAAGGIAAARWRRGGRHETALPAHVSPAEVAASGSGSLPPGAAAGIGTALAGRAGLMAAGIAGGASVAGAGAVAMATPAALSLERAMADVQRATRASSQELQGYQDHVLRLARTTGRTKEEIAGLMAAGASERRRGQDLADYAALAARASQAWGERADKTGETLAALGNIYRANQPRLEGIADAIQTAADATSTRASDISGFLRHVGQEGAAVGISAENMAAYGASLRRAGADGPAAQKAMSSIVDTLSQAGDQGKDFDAALRTMGLRTRSFAQAFRRDANGTILDFLERLQRLSPDKRNSAISNIFGNDQAEEIRRLAEQVTRVRELQRQLTDRNRTRGAVGRQFDIVSEADFAKLERAQQAIDTLITRLGRLGKVAGGAVADLINRSVDALEPSRAEAAASREQAASQKLADLERQLAEARGAGGLAGRVAGLEAAVAEARREWQEATRGMDRPSGLRSERARTARGLEPEVLEQRPVDPRMRRNHERYGGPTPRPAEARSQDAAAMRAELEKTEAAIAAIEERLQGLRHATVGAPFNAPERAALTDALAELDRLQAKAAEIDATMKTLFGPEFSSRAGSAAQEAAGRINSALDGAASSAHAAGQKISAQLAAGITAGGPAVSAAMQGVAARAMRNVPQSPAKEGPFRRLGHAGEQIVAQLAAGMTGNDVTDRMRSVADAAMSSVRPNAGAWPLPQRASAGEAAAGGASGGGGDRLIHVEVHMGGVTISPGGQSLDDAARALGDRVAGRVRSSLHESRT